MVAATCHDRRAIPRRLVWLKLLGVLLTLWLCQCAAPAADVPVPDAGPDAKLSDGGLSDTAPADTPATDTWKHLELGKFPDTATKPDAVKLKPDATTAAETCIPSCPSGEYCTWSNGLAKCTKMQCIYPTSWGKTVQKFSKFEMAPGMVGCDWNGDGKPDNAWGGGLAMLSPQLNDAAKKNIAEGQLVYLLESADFQADGTPFSLNLLYGGVDPSSATCDFTSQAGQCHYTANKQSYDPAGSMGACPARIHFASAKASDGQLVAESGPLEPPAPIEVVKGEGVSLALPLWKVRLVGTLGGGSAWATTSSGLLCAVVRKQDLQAILGSSGYFWSTGTPDLSTNGEEMDAYSVAYAWESVAGDIVALTPDAP